MTHLHYMNGLTTTRRGLLMAKILPCVLTPYGGQQTVVLGKTRIKLLNGLVAPNNHPISYATRGHNLFSFHCWCAVKRMSNS
jgi:hypothetical protein